jgi:hypothetical protein
MASVSSVVVAEANRWLRVTANERADRPSPGTRAVARELPPSTPAPGRAEHRGVIRPRIGMMGEWETVAILID